MSDSRTGVREQTRTADGRGTEREWTDVSRRALLVAGGVGLTAGCLRLDSGGGGSGSDDGGGSDGGSSGDDGSGGNGPTNRLQVFSTTGIVAQSAPEVVMTNMTVKRAPGSSDIDLSTVGVAMSTENYEANFVHASGDGSPVYYLEPIQTDDQSNTVLASDSDRYTIKLPLGSIPGDSDPAASDPADGVTSSANTDLSPLGEGASAVVELVTAEGGSTEVNAVVPQTLADTDTVRL